MKKEIYLVDPCLVALLNYETSNLEFCDLLKPIKIMKREYIFFPINSNENKYTGGGTH